MCDNQTILNFRGLLLASKDDVRCSNTTFESTDLLCESIVSASHNVS